MGSNPIIRLLIESFKYIKMDTSTLILKRTFVKRYIIKLNVAAYNFSSRKGVLKNLNRY